MYSSPQPSPCGWINTILFPTSISAASFNSNTVGGITTYYTVTAKTGNVITVDRSIEGKLLHYDTMVVKLDRAIQIYSESHIPFGPYGSNGNVDEQVSCELVNFTALSMGNGS